MRAAGVAQEPGVTSQDGSYPRGWDTGLGLLSHRGEAELSPVPQGLGKGALTSLIFVIAAL